MAAALDIRYIDPSVPASVSAYQVSAAIPAAFDDWTRRIADAAACQAQFAGIVI